MPMLIGLLALVAIVGIFKPFIPKSERWHYVAGFLVFAGASSATRDASPPAAKTVATEQVSVSGAAAAVAANSKQSAPFSAPIEENWTYSVDKDQMRGTVARFASVQSDNEINLGFPYGVVHGTITIRKRPEDGLKLMFSVEKGQILCHSYSDSYVSVKFDDGPIHEYKCSGTADGTSETTFISQSASFLAGLKKAKHVVVEAQFYQQGRQQFAFSTKGLKWQ